MRRLVASSVVLALSTLTLAACGDETTDTGSVTVSGAFGKEPKVTYEGKVVREKTSVDVLTKGKGEVVKDGDSATIDYYIGNGYDGKQVFSSFEGDQEPQLVTFTKDGVLTALYKAVVGHKVGSRLEVVAAPKDAWGKVGGNAELGVGNNDTVVFVVDIVEKSGAKDVDASEVAKVIETGGKPTALDFTGLPATPASDDLLRATLKKGDGKEIKPGDTVKVNYLGMVYGSDKVFDETFSEGKSPFEVTVGKSDVITGWHLGLSGARVGSRIELVIPGDLGYGAGGREPDIKPNDTLVFVMDIVSAS